MPSGFFFSGIVSTVDVLVPVDRSPVFVVPSPVVRLPLPDPPPPPIVDGQFSTHTGTSPALFASAIVLAFDSPPLLPHDGVLLLLDDDEDDRPEPIGVPEPPPVVRFPDPVVSSIPLPPVDDAPPKLYDCRVWTWLVWSFQSSR